MQLWSPRPKFYRPANHHADFHSDERERHDDGHLDRGARQFIQVYPAGSYVRIWMASGGRGDVPILFVFPVRRSGEKGGPPRRAAISLFFGGGGGGGWRQKNPGGGGQGG